MGYEASSTPPKLSLYSLQSKPKEPPGLLTPPLHTLASIPFKWEEAPGKPRATTTTHHTPPRKTACRSLELPPRLLSDTTKITNMSSPTRVLEGPYVGKSLSKTQSFSYRRKGSVNNIEEGGRVWFGKRESLEKLRSPRFGSMRFGGFMQNRGVVRDTFDFSAYGSGCDYESDSTVKITRVRRRSNSFLSFSHRSSNLLTSIYGSLKQAAPWRRSKQERKRMVGL